MIYLYIIIAALTLLLLYVYPFLKPRKKCLPVLLFSKIGTPFTSSKDKSCWTGIKQLEKLFCKLKQQHFTTVLPAEVLANQLSEKSVLLLFSGGYQSFCTTVFPLLQKYQFKAAVSLPLQYLSQYDAWETNGPWQNLLTLSQIQELQASGLVEFVSQGLTGLLTDQTAWEYTEAKSRWEHLYKMPVKIAFIPTKTPNAKLVQNLLPNYSLLITARVGNNALPLSNTAPLRVFPIRRRTILHRLCWKLTRV